MYNHRSDCLDKVPKQSFLCQFMDFELVDDGSLTAKLKKLIF